MQDKIEVGFERKVLNKWKWVKIFVLSKCARANYKYFQFKCNYFKLSQLLFWHIDFTRKMYNSSDNS